MVDAVAHALVRHQVNPRVTEFTGSVKHNGDLPAAIPCGVSFESIQSFEQGIRHTVELDLHVVSAVSVVQQVGQAVDHQRVAVGSGAAAEVVRSQAETISRHTAEIAELRASNARLEGKVDALLAYFKIPAGGPR